MKLTKICTWPCRLMMFAVKFYVYICVGATLNVHNFWSWTYEPQGNQCKHKPLAANKTGLKVLVYGLARTGTKTMSRALMDVGIKSFHSEDFKYHIWSPLVDNFYMQPENGGKIWAMNRLATPSAPAFKGHSFAPFNRTSADLQVLDKMKMEDFASEISRCRPDAVLFDGIEQLFWPIYDLSPDVKVIVLNWRTYQQYVTSGTYYGPAPLYALGLLVAGMHFLPWNAFVLPLLDPLFGNQIHDYMRGGIPFHQGVNTTMGSEPLLICLFRMQMAEHRMLSHYYGGMGFGPRNEFSYNAYWDAVKIIPEERRFNWNMKKHGHKDLCEFLNISGNPNCELPGPLPKSGINVGVFEREQPLKNLIIVPLYFIFLHVMNWKLVWGFFGWFWQRTSLFIGLFKVKTL